jgi:hypothetical protein
MKVIDLTPEQEEDGTVQQWISQTRDVLGITDADLEAQEIAIGRLQKGLDNRFTCLSNIPLEGGEIPIPMILVGPPGVYVMNTSGEKGVFQVKEDDWREMEPGSRKYQKVENNMVKRTQRYVQIADTYLTLREQAHPEISPVLLFTDPGVHVESTRPAVRIVLMDGIDRFVSDIISSENSLSSLEVRNIVSTFEKAQLDMVGADGYSDGLSDLDAESKASEEPARPMPQLNLPPFLANLNFSMGQWIILAVLAVASAIALMALTLLVIFAT